MSVSVVSAWEKLSDDANIACFENLRQVMESSAALTTICQLDSFNSDQNKTLAENFGQYYRETFSLYKALIESMKVERHWQAIHIHSTEHSFWEEDEWTTWKTEEAELQLKGYGFDPLVFDFKWIDNSLQQPFFPWSLVVDFFTRDVDDQVAYLNSVSGCLLCSHMATAGDATILEIWGLQPDLPVGMKNYGQL